MFDFNRLFSFSDFKKKMNSRNLWFNWRLMSFRKFLYLPRILSQQEKRLYLLLFLVTLLSAGGFFGKIYLGITKPVPAVGKSYAEGLLKEPRTINPIYASQDEERDLSRLIFSGLLTYSGEGKIEPDLAEKYEISQDGKIYTITLKKNILWHDGKLLKADDVVFTVKTVQNPQYRSVLRANWQGVVVEKLDEYTVRFSLRAPYAPFIENLTMGIIPQHLWEKVSPEQALLHELNLKPIGSGPYKFGALKQAKDGSLFWYEVTRNLKYYREGPHLKSIIFKFFKNEDELIAALNKGTINGVAAIPVFRLAELDPKTISVFSLQTPRIFGLFFNQKKAPALADQKVREALARAINKMEIVQKATGGGITSADGPLPFMNPTSDLNQPFKKNYDYNLDISRRLLEEAGWKQNNNGIREKTTLQKGKKTTTTLQFTLVTSDWPELLKTAELIKMMLKKTGIGINIEKRSFAELELAIFRPRNFEILLFGQVYGYEPDPFAFWHSSQIKDPGLNIALYANRKTDKVLEEMRQISDPILRKKKYDEFSTLITQDLPATFLYTQLYSYLLPADMKGISLTKISLPSDRFNGVNKWYRKTTRVLR